MTSLVLAATGVLGAIQGQTPPTFNVDLYLVANNDLALGGFASANGGEQTRIQKILVNAARKQDNDKKSFVVVDAGNLQALKIRDGIVTVLNRTYELEPVNAPANVKGAPLYSTNVFSSTGSSTFIPYHQKGSFATEFVQLGKDLQSQPSTKPGIIEPTFGIESLACQRSNRGPDQKYRGIMLNYCDLSIRETIDAVSRDLPNYNQVCICAWGYPIAEKPNFISFPPAGVVKHYKFGFDGKNWFAELLEVLR